ncbi:CopZ family metallochaperone [Thiohalorhabdus sp. Cl-TMA]|uniref:Heavy-metal-associated domain-containing protein n=1 Tax=Thiohalorhabdus methylotrophus TaxID=3242694 RepID=A0ABV4TVW8_9GAMM
MAGTTLKVTGMTCRHCVNAVKEVLEEVNGVESAEVSLEEGRAEVTGNADPSALIKAVAEEGYEAEVAT